MSSTILRSLMISRRARLWVPLALLSALPLAVAAGDDPSETKPATERPAASKTVDNAKEPLVSLDIRNASLEDIIKVLMKKTQIGSIVLVPAEPGRAYALVTAKLAEQPLSKVLTAVAKAAGAKVTKEKDIYYLRPLTTAQGTPRAFIVPTPQAPTRPRDLLYRGENAGPYHAIYLQGVPPGVRIKGVTPPPIIEPRIHLVVPKAAPSGKSRVGEKK